MTFFIDANPIVYSATEGPARDSCLRVLAAVAAGEADGRTSSAVLEEAWHVSLRQYRGELDGVVRSALTIFAPLVPVTERSFEAALGLELSALGANDRLHVGTCMVEGIETVLTADRAFDSVPGIRRVDPFDADAVEALLAA